jgi:hypothetical protein
MGSGARICYTLWPLLDHCTTYERDACEALGCKLHARMHTVLRLQLRGQTPLSVVTAICWWGWDGFVVVFCIVMWQLHEAVVGCTLSVLLSVMVMLCGVLDCYHRCAASACPWLGEVAGIDGWWALLCHALWLPRIIICLVLLCSLLVPQASVEGGKS